MKKKTILLLAALNIGTVFALAAIWEFGLEASVFATLFADVAHETRGEHWEYVITSTCFAGFALIMPLALSFRISAQCEQAEEALRVSEQRARVIADALPSRISYVDREQRYRFNNRAYEEFYKTKSDDLYGKKVRDLLGEDTYSKIEKYIARVFSGERVQYELEQFVGSDQRYYDITYVPDFDGADSVRGFYVLINDVTDRKRAADDLFHEKERAQVTLESIADAVITTDPLAKIDYLNPVAATLTGWSQDEARGQRLNQVFRVISEESATAMPDPVTQCLADGCVVELQGQNLLLNRTGQEYAIQATASPIRGRQGQVLGAVLVFHDVTEMRRMAQQLAYDAAHDPLTGLVNRREFAKRLERSVASAKQHGSHHALCYFDLDLFKLVNDTAGHHAGDELLKQVRGLLSGKVRQRDTLARLGGDEFGLLLDNCLLDDAEKICEVIVGTFRDFRFFWEGRAFQVGASVGLVPITADAGDAVELLTHADVACYTAKEQGRSRVHVYRKEGSAPPRRHGEMLLASNLHSALEQQRFRLDYQPIVSLTNGETATQRFELLLRLSDAEGTTVPPESFIPVAERYGLMGAIDRWVIRAALQWCEDTVVSNGNIEIAINLSSCSLKDDTLPDFLRDALAGSRVVPHQICFEITEMAALHNLQHASEFLRELKKCGFSLAVDDFGSGRTCFSYLKMLPADYLKIDGSLVEGIIESRIDHAMVAAINEIGHIMGMKTIGEHAHNAAVVSRLRELGVDAAQGFAFGRPRPLDELRLRDSPRQ